MPVTEVAVERDLMYQHEDENDGFWSFSLFGCHEDLGLCLCTTCLPCYTLGRNAEAMGEDGLISGILYGVGLFAFGPMIRWRLRQKKKIKGSMVGDVLLHVLLPCCSLVQENRELYGAAGSHVGEKIPINIEVQRQ